MRSAVVWFTGLPSSGKSALARKVFERLRSAGAPCLILDGDEIRDAVVPRFGHDEAGRGHFYETLARLAAMHARQGLVVLVPATAHRAIFRERARGMTARFIEVHVATTLEEAQRRDHHKKLYEAGKASVPGQGVVFEAPLTPDVVASGAYDEPAIERILRAVQTEPQSEPSTYVALSIRPSVELVRSQEAMCNRFGLVPRAELHLTLAYLGELSWDRLLEAGTVLRRVPTVTAPAEVSLSGAGGIARSGEGTIASTPEALADPRAERVAWWSVAPNDSLNMLRGLVVKTLAGGQFDVARADTFFPHVTLGSNTADPGESSWDLHDIPKLPTLGPADWPSVGFARLHLTSASKNPGSLFVLRHLHDDPL